MVEDDAQAGHLKEVGHGAEEGQVADVADAVDGQGQGQHQQQADLLLGGVLLAHAIDEKLLQVGGDEGEVDAAAADLGGDHRAQDHQRGGPGPGTQRLRPEREGVQGKLQKR